MCSNMSPAPSHFTVAQSIATTIKIGHQPSGRDCTQSSLLGMYALVWTLEFGDTAPWPTGKTI